MRLIDADALREVMYHEAFETDTDMQKWDGGCWIRYKMFENAIDDAPTIDPVRHGRWMVSEDGIMECSECGWLFSYMPGLEQEWNYCPHCGARMDGDDNEAD